MKPEHMTRDELTQYVLNNEQEVGPWAVTLAMNLQAENDVSRMKIIELENEFEDMDVRVMNLLLEKENAINYLIAQIRKLQEQTERQARMILRLEKYAERWQIARDLGHAWWEAMSSYSADERDEVMDTVREDN